MSDPDRRYQLQRRLGRGGFGEVWLAVREAGGVRSEVAVKLLHEGLDPGAQALQRLRDEGRILGLLNHPVILKVLDLTTLDGRVALVTEYVDGADLQECFVAERMPVRALVEVIGRVADALAVAWSAPSPTGGSLQLLHRDVKPANVRIGRHGDVKLLDFGIARAADPGREAHTKTAALIGTLSYLSPERFDPRHPGGPASDVFALGAVLYEGLAGEQLVEPLSSREQYLLALDPDEFAVFVQSRLAPLTEPEPLTALLARMLAYDPEARPTAAEVAHQCEPLAEALPGPGLRRYTRDRRWSELRVEPASVSGRTYSNSDPTDTASSVALPPAAPGPAPRPARWPWVAAAGGIALAATGTLALAGVVLLAVVGGSSRPAPPEAPLAPIAAPAAPAPSPVPTPDPVPLVPVAPKPGVDRPPERPPSGSFSAEGDVPVELRAGGRVFGPGPVPAEPLEIWADFGGGHEPMGEASVTAGASFTIRCSRLRHNCTGAP